MNKLFKKTIFLNSDDIINNNVDVSINNDIVRSIDGNIYCSYNKGEISIINGEITVGNNEGKIICEKGIVELKNDFISGSVKLGVEDCLFFKKHQFHIEIINGEIIINKEVRINYTNLSNGIDKCYKYTDYYNPDVIVYDFKKKKNFIMEDEIVIKCYLGQKPLGFDAEIVVSSDSVIIKKI